MLPPRPVFRPAQASASSCTLGPHLGPQPGSAGSGVRFEFPKNYFVWGFLKSDSQPYKPTSVLHIFFGLGQNRPSAPPAGQRGLVFFFSGRRPLPRPAWAVGGGTFLSRPIGPPSPPGHPPAYLAGRCPHGTGAAPIRKSALRRAERCPIRPRGVPGRRAIAGCNRPTLPGSRPKLPGSWPKLPGSWPTGPRHLKPPVGRAPQGLAAGLPAPRNRRFQARPRGRGRCPVTHPPISPAAGPVEAAVPPPKSPRFPKANAGGPAPAGRLAAAQWSISSGFRVAWAALSGSLARSRPVLRPPAAGTSRPRVPQAFCGRPPA